MDRPVCNLVFSRLEKKGNKHPKFDTNFDIRRRLEHFEYDMNRTLVLPDLCLVVLGMFLDMKLILLKRIIYKKTATF